MSSPASLADMLAASVVLNAAIGTIGMKPTDLQPRAYFERWVEGLSKGARRRLVARARRTT